MKNHRRKISSEQKVMMLREHLENDVSITDLAEKYRIHPNLIGRWKKELFEGAVTIFDKKSKSLDKRKDRKITDLKVTLQKRDTLIAHLVSENVELKKNELGGD
jgi:transposase-like protein